MDYARFVLYVKKGIPTCDGLVKLASRSHEVIIQDVETISGPRPAWLRGVPTLVKLPGYSLHTGSEAIRLLREFLETGIQAMELGTIGRGAGAASLDDDFSSPGQSRATASGPASAYGDSKYEDGPKDKNAGGPTLEDMLRRRGASAAAS